MAAGLEQLRLKSPGGANDPTACIFALSNIATRTIGGVTYQVCAYKSSTDYLVIGIRTYPFGRWKLYHYNGTDQSSMGTTAADSHFVHAIEIDADGLIHIAWGMHADALKYRRSNASVASWTGPLTAAQSFLGTNETQCTYPCFFRDPVTGTLYFTYRSGASGVADQYFYVWDDGTDTWAAAAGTDTATGKHGRLINATDDSMNAYLNGAPKFSPDWDGAGTGWLHWSWCWRDSTDPWTNHDLVHCKWDGTNWKTFGGSAQTVPITPSNGDKILTLAAGTTNYMDNSVDFDLTSDGYPVIGLITKDGGGKSQLWAYWWNGSSWTQTQITSYGTSDITDWGRPLVVVNRDTNQCFMVGGHRTHSSVNVQQWTSSAGDFSTWSELIYYAHTDYGGAEMGYDRTCWLTNHRICSLVTKSDHSSVTPGVVKVLERAPKNVICSTSRLRYHSITVDHTKVGSGGASNFSVLLTRVNFADEVCDPSGSNKALADGGDLIFTSDIAGTTRLPCHVVLFGHDSSSGAGDAVVEIYVKIPSLSSSSNTSFYVWYNVTAECFQPFVDETYGQYAAYDNRAIFQPFSRSMDNVASDALVAADASSTQNAYGSGKVGEGMVGATNRGWQWDAATITIANAFAIAAWVSVGATISAVMEILVNDRTASTTDDVMQFRVDTNGLLRFVRYNSSQVAVANFTGASDLRNGGFKRVWAVFDTTNGSIIYVNGSSDGTNANLTANRNLGSYLGTGFRPYHNDLYFIGPLDNVELHTATRNLAWIQTDFNNQNSPSTFATPGTPAGIAFSVGDIASGEAFGDHSIANQALTTSAIASGEAFGSHRLKAEFPVGDIDSAETLGAILVILANTLYPSGLVSEEALGDLFVGASITLPSIDSAEFGGIGSILGTGGETIALTGIESAEAEGGIVLLGHMVLPALASGEALGSVALLADGSMIVWGIASGEALGPMMLKGRQLRRIRMRVTNVQYGSPGLIVVQCVEEDAGNYTNFTAVGGSPLGGEPESVSGGLPGATRLMLLDSVILRDKDDEPGYYAAAAGFNTAWRGCLVSKSEDSGASWDDVAAIKEESILGYARSALGNTARPEDWDAVNTVSIQLLKPSVYTLESDSELNILNGSNAGALIDVDGNVEVFQWKDAAAGTGGIYTLSNLLRGRKGSEYAMAGHRVGDLFVKLDANKLKRISAGLGDIGVDCLYAATSIGTAFETAVRQRFTYEGNGLKPLSPVHVAGARDGSNNLTVTFIARTRIAQEWRDAVDSPVGEATQSYELDVYDGSGYNTVKRTIASTTMSFAYSAANQTADFGSPQATVYVKIYQLSPSVGRGFAAVVSV